jgi:hypothetical protein
MEAVSGFVGAVIVGSTFNGSRARGRKLDTAGARPDFADEGHISEARCGTPGSVDPR